jgi:sigma-B regulation protein RsbU (phosphoserine phosphatase)
MMTDDAVVDVSHDWLQACSVQERFMRGPLLNSSKVEYAASCRQLRALGGDCYDFTCLENGRLAMLVGDASGKGIAAALMMASVQASLRTAAQFTGNDLAALFRAVNLQACASSLDDRYATLFYGVLDRATLRLSFVNAGHNPPLVVHRDGSFDRLEPSGAPVGLFPDAAWQAQAVQLSPGDLLIAYTDGVTEACSPTGQEWGMDGLADAVIACYAQSPNHMVRSILDSMDQFSRGVQTDDVTVTVLRAI